jgi:hypothetical protein
MRNIMSVNKGGLITSTIGKQVTGARTIIPAVSSMGHSVHQDIIITGSHGSLEEDTVTRFRNRSIADGVCHLIMGVEEGITIEGLNNEDILDVEIKLENILADTTIAITDAIQEDIGDETRPIISIFSSLYWFAKTRWSPS